MQETMTVNGNAYTIVRLLGKGKGGYSYLAERDGVQYVLKQIHHEPCAYYQFGDKMQAELHDYERLRGIGIPMPQMLDVDIANERILKEYIPGDTIFELVKTDRMREEYVAQVKEMCRLLYPANTNIDYFPTVSSKHIFYGKMTAVKHRINVCTAYSVPFISSHILKQSNHRYSGIVNKYIYMA